MASEGALSFDGRWVVVSGASSGIGRAIAIALSRRGARLILLGRDAARLAETARHLSGDHQALSFDLRPPDQIAERVMPLFQSVGRIYGLCHAAGCVETRPLASSTVKGMQAVLEVNLMAGLELARVVSRRDVMTEGEGRLLFISSVYGQVGQAGQVAYSATKGAVAAAVRSLAIEMARRKVCVNALSPGLVRTEMAAKAFALLSPAQAEQIEKAHPLGVGTPDDVAHAAVFLLAPESAWITGVDLAVDGGYTAQ